LALNTSGALHYHGCDRSERVALLPQDCTGVACLQIALALVYQVLSCTSARVSDVETARCSLCHRQSCVLKYRAMAWLNSQQPTSVPLGRSGRIAASATEAKLDDHQIVSMYASPPDGGVIIEDFERFAIARLRGAWHAQVH
jgi:hypothetical protein